MKQPRIVVNGDAFVVLLRWPDFFTIGPINTDDPPGTVGYIDFDQTNSPGPIRVPVIFGGDDA